MKPLMVMMLICVAVLPAIKSSNKTHVRYVSTVKPFIEVTFNLKEYKLNWLLMNKHNHLIKELQYICIYKHEHGLFDTI